MKKRAGQLCIDVQLPRCADAEHENPQMWHGCPKTQRDKEQKAVRMGQEDGDSKTAAMPKTRCADWRNGFSYSGAWHEALRDRQERFAQVAGTAAGLLHGLPDLLLQLPLDFHLLLVQ